MKKSILIAVLSFGICAGALAQGNIMLNAAKNEFKVLDNSKGSFTVSINLANIKTITVSTPQGYFTELLPEGFTQSYNLGKPQLPTLNKLIEIPYNATVEVNILGIKEETVDLGGHGLVNKLMPCQPSMFKNEDVKDVPFYYDQAFYQQDAFTAGNICEVTTQGIMRGVQMGKLTINPFSYNPVQNVLKVYNELVIEIRFHHADYTLTEQMKAKYYSPAFEPAFGSMINYKSPIQKDVISKYPIKYVIVGPSTIGGTSVQTLMLPFVRWKSQKGFHVVEQYYSSAPSTATVKSYLQGLYTAGTPSDPAPTYVLFVGDVAQIPANNGTTATHPTDLYYCTFDGTGDYIPDMYYGRFSATSAAHITTQVNKTLQYEKYTMPKKTYLDTVVMVAGCDNSWSTTHANGQINYGADNYFNLTHGMYSYTHLYNASCSQDAAIRAEIGNGVGYANYTAHCSSSGWADPEFLTSHISAMNNADKYGLIVGNCCLSNKFNDPVCFGEALLREENKGAVGYIGGSNNTYWNEDFYWGVGKRTTITANPTYDAGNLGAYDCMFHDHGEPKTQWFITNSQMIYAGNLAVESSNSTYKKYYWEIYHLMGDPSVMTYFSMPDPLAVSYTDPQMVGVTTLQVNTEEDAYVAISDDYVLLDAQLAPAGGVVTLTFPAFTLPDTADIVVTKQNKEPYIGTVVFLAPSLPLDASISGIAVPEAAYNCSGVDITPEVTLTNMGTQTLTSVTINYYVDANPAATYNWAGSLASMQSATVTLPDITLTAGNHVFTASTSNPNGSTDQNPGNDTKTKDYTVNNLPVSAAFTASGTSFCQAPATVTFTNQSTNAQTYQWDFGDGSTGTDQNPVHTFTNPGIYTVTLTADAGVCGTDAEIKSSYIIVGAQPPVTTGASHCGPASLTLSASGTGNISWFDALTGGTLQGNGTTYTTPVISNTTTYFAENEETSPPQSCGSPDVNTNGSNYYQNAERSLIFDAYVPFTLVSVQVNANSAGIRTIKLQNSSDSTLAQQSVNIPAGVSTVTLNFQVPVGTDHKLVGPVYCNLYRNDAGCAYPYTISGVCSITSSSATTNPTGFYYFFYNWIVQEPSCVSGRVPAVAEILSSAPVAGFSWANTGLLVNFTNTSANGSSYYWDFGDGATSTDANPSHTYPGNAIYQVMLITTNDCGSDTTYVDVNLMTVATAQQETESVHIYPNPAKGKTTLYFGSFSADKAELYDVTGRILRAYANPGEALLLDLSPYGDGIYYIRLSAGNDIRTLKITNIQ